VHRECLDAVLFQDFPFSGVDVSQADVHAERGVSAAGSLHGEAVLQHRQSNSHVFWLEARFDPFVEGLNVASRQSE
jgi:hypothetical protein